MTREFEMYQSEYDGDITMYNGAARVSTYSFDVIGLTVNRVEVPDDALIFPGAYEFGTTLEEFAIEGEATLAALEGEVSDRAVVTVYESLRIDITLEGLFATGTVDRCSCGCSGARDVELDDRP